MHQDATLYEGRCQSRRLCVRWGPSFPSPKGAQSPQFSANVRCGQTTGWSKMALGMEVGLGPGDFVFGGDPATPRNREHTHHHPVFGPCLLWPNGWMDEDATWYGSRPRLRPYCIRRSPSFGAKRHSSPPSFRPMSIVATVAHLSYCWALVKNELMHLSLINLILWSILCICSSGKHFSLLACD